MNNRFNVDLLYLITHNAETKKIAGEIKKGKWSDYVRQSIIQFAKSKGFTIPNERPDYMPPEKWHIIEQRQPKKRNVDYTYLIAYFWLKSRPPYVYYAKSQLIRMAIIWHSKSSIQTAECPSPSVA